MANYYPTPSPPLQHPVPTRPTYIPDAPSTPGSPQGYQRHVSSPGSPSQQHAHVPAYTTPFAHPSHPQPQVLQQQQPGSGTTPPDFVAWGVDDATAQFGMQLGSSAVAAGQQYVQRNFGGIFPTTHIKRHFNVSNSYVIHKIRIVLFPWMHKPWARRIRQSENGQTEWQSPRDDLNSPDLYIPLMALVTYIMIVAFQAGLSSKFYPSVLGESASRAILVVFTDFCLVKLGCYLLNVQGSSQVVDLISYVGYKFVGVIMVLIFGFNLVPFGITLYPLAFIYAFLANAFFLLRSLRSVFLPDTTATSGTVNPTQRRKRIAFLFLQAVSQVLYMWILVRV